MVPTSSPVPSVPEVVYFKYDLNPLMTVPSSVTSHNSLTTPLPWHESEPVFFLPTPPLGTSGLHVLDKFSSCDLRDRLSYRKFLGSRLPRTPTSPTLSEPYLDLYHSPSYVFVRLSLRSRSGRRLTSVHSRRDRVYCEKFERLDLYTPSLSEVSCWRFRMVGCTRVIRKSLDSIRWFECRNTKLKSKESWADKEGRTFSGYSSRYWHKDDSETGSVLVLWLIPDDQVLPGSRPLVRT